MLEFTIKISVIIPVYNVENYLHQCIDSVLNQNYTNIEVILINDGSTDRSGIICNDYAQKDQRVKALHQENQGVAVARNLGLKHATGDYINFIDSDDWINQGMYLDIVTSIQKSECPIDILYMPYPNEETKKDNIVYDKAKIRAEFLHHFIGTKKVGSSTRMACVWTLCIHRELIKDLLFYPIAIVEDKPFFIEAILRANSLLIIQEKYYNYRLNVNSLSHNYHTEFIQGVTLGHRIITEMLKKYASEYPNLNTLNNNSIVYFYYHAIKNELNSKDPIHNINTIRQSIEQYYIENKLNDLLTWERTFRLSYRNPKWLLVKFGYADTFLNILWKRKIKYLKRTPSLLPQF